MAKKPVTWAVIADGGLARLVGPDEDPRSR